MPIYTYRCASCGETFDRRQSFSDAALTTHETCGGDLRKVLHPAGIVFKGSGFYNTDYKNGKNGSAAKSDGGTPSETAAASTNGTSESKPESKGESTGSASTSTSTDAGSAGSAATTAKSEPAKSGSTG